jgi:CheY-like chemotaxis protein
MTNALIIDDEPAIRSALTRVLQHAGFSVRTAANGNEGLQALQTGETDIVIADIIMPGKNGVETIAAIRAAFPAIRIVAISGGGNFDIAAYKPGSITTTAYLAAAQKAGAHALLTKPFRTQDIIAAINTALNTGFSTGAHESLP